jgi:hypothetical protein
MALAHGFAFGVVREMFVVPRPGSELAILVETPLMAIVAWFTLPPASLSQSRWFSPGAAASTGGVGGRVAAAAFVGGAIHMLTPDGAPVGCARLPIGIRKWPTRRPPPPPMTS